MARLDRKAKGALTNQALSVISAESTALRRFELGTDDVVQALRVDYPTFWLNLQPDKDTYYQWSKRTEEKLFSTVHAFENFEDDSVGNWATGSAGYALSSVAVDGNEIIEGTYSLKAVSSGDGSDTECFGDSTARAFVVGNYYLIKFYTYGSGLIASSNDEVIFDFYSNAVGNGTALSGSWTAISGELNTKPVINSDYITYHEYLFAPSASATGYSRFRFYDASGSALTLYVDNFSIQEIPSSKWVPYNAIDTTNRTPNHMYGDSEYQKKVRWGHADDRSQREMYLVLKRKIAGITYVSVTEG